MSQATPRIGSKLKVAVAAGKRPGRIFVWLLNFSDFSQE